MKHSLIKWSVPKQTYIALNRLHQNPSSRIIPSPDNGSVKMCKSKNNTQESSIPGTLYNVNHLPQFTLKLTDDDTSENSDISIIQD